MTVIDNTSLQKNNINCNLLAKLLLQIKLNFVLYRTYPD